MELIPDPKILATQIVGFILVILVFWKYLWGPILGIIDQRRQEIEKTYSDAEEDRQGAADLKADYDQRLAGVETEVREKITQAAKDGQALREEIVSEARQKADEVRARAEEHIEREKDKAVLEIKTRVADLAVGAARKLIDERLDDAKHRELVEKYVDGLTEVAK